MVLINFYFNELQEWKQNWQKESTKQEKKWVKVDYGGATDS